MSKHTFPVINNKWVVDKEATITREDGEVKAIYFDGIGNPSKDVCIATRQHNLECKIVFPEVTFYEGCKRVAKIVATIGETNRIAGLPVIEFEDNLDELATIALRGEMYNPDHKYKRPFPTHHWQEVDTWIKGYKAAQSKGCWTDEDFLRYIDIRMKLWKESIKTQEFKDESNPFEASAIAMHKRTLEAMKQPQITEVELEVETNLGWKDAKDEKNAASYGSIETLKITSTTPQGDVIIIQKT